MVTRNLRLCHMRCDNIFPRCGESDEFVNLAILECPPSLQAWALSATPSSPNIFLTSSVFTNMNYLFGSKSCIEDPTMNRNPYPWIIWYLWKTRNDKLFRGIDRDHLELIRYTEGDCHAWYLANADASIVNHQPNVIDSQAICLHSICLVDGSWTFTVNFSGYGWVWKDMPGKTQLMSTKNKSIRKSSLHSKLKTLVWAMENMLSHSTCQNFRTNWKNLIAMIGNQKCDQHFDRAKGNWGITTRFNNFKLSNIFRRQNVIAYFLPMTARDFHMNFYLLVVLFRSDFSYTSC